MANQLVNVIGRRERLRWDLFTFFAIVLCAFEVPYGVFVGYDQDSPLALYFGAFFSTVFFYDIFLNLRTRREEDFGGFWGWRYVVQLIVPSVSPLRQQGAQKPAMLTEPTAVASGYLRSGWFLVDFLSAIPWILIAQNVELLILIRLMRFLRFARLLQLLRLRRSVRLIVVALNRWTSVTPALGRLMLMLLSVPWVIHVHACVYCTIGSTPSALVPGERLATYFDKLYKVFLILVGGDANAEAVGAEKLLMVSAIFFSAVLILGVFGNFIAFLTSVDMGQTKKQLRMRRGHAVLVGWNLSSCSIVDQLMSETDESRGDLVILSEREPEEVWSEITERCEATEHANIEVVKGSPHSRKDLMRVHVSTARFALIVGNGNDGRQTKHAKHGADLHVLKTLLCLCSVVKASMESNSGLRKGCRSELITVVTEASCALSKRVIGNGVPSELRAFVELIVVDVSLVMERLSAHIVAEPKLAAVYDDLLSYEMAQVDGCEFYFVDLPSEFEGIDFESARQRYQRCCVVGFTDVEERVFLNPDFGVSRPLQKGEKLIVVAEDRESMVVQSSSLNIQRSWDSDNVLSVKPKRVLVIGRGELVDSSTRLLLDFLPEGSRVITSPEFPEFESGQSKRVSFAGAPDGIGKGAFGLAVWLKDEELYECDVLAILAEGRESNSHDAESLMALSALEMKLHNIGEVPSALVVQSLGNADTDLLALYRSPVLLETDRFLSNFLVQVARSPLRYALFEELLQAEGHELYLRPASWFMSRDETSVSYSTLAERARTKNELCIGYYAHGQRSVQLVPKHPEKLHPRDHYAELVVFAER